MAATIEKRASDLEEMVGDIPRLINVRFAHMRAQIEALDARLGTLEVKVDTLKAKVQALPRIIAEMLDERERRNQSRHPGESRGPFLRYRRVGRHTEFRHHRTGPRLSPG